MKTYKITNTASGIEMGTYKGESEQDALDAMARDAGYADYEDAQRVAPCDTIQVTEVSAE